jgi:hypothetical protein
VMREGDLGINFMEKWKGNLLGKKERNRGGQEREEGEEGKREINKGKKRGTEAEKSEGRRQGGTKGNQ